MVLLRRSFLSEWVRPNRQRLLVRILAFSVFILVVLALSLPRNGKSHVLRLKEGDSTPLIMEYIDNEDVGKLGRWYIPEDWLDTSSSRSVNPQHPIEAAQLALDLAVHGGHFIKNTNIPLIVHQIWQDFDSSQWSLVLKNCVETWLETATGHAFPNVPEKLTYILWTHEAADWFMAHYEPEAWPSYSRLPRQVEKSDVFRVAIQRWFGGIYGDLDSLPLKHPYLWAKDVDLTEWESKEGLRYGLGDPTVKPYTAPPEAIEKPFPSAPQDRQLSSYSAILKSYSTPRDAHVVSAISGIECDLDPSGTHWWRIGYFYPVQVTNWAFALAPQHPVASIYLQNLQKRMSLHDAGLTDITLEFTGPPAFTAAVKQYAEQYTVTLGAEQAHHDPFNWYSVTGRYDPSGGRAKVVGDNLLVLPITGFSPGRGIKDRMGSEPITHPEARLLHFAAGSWRKFKLSEELKKVCRLIFGACKKTTIADLEHEAAGTQL